MRQYIALIHKDTNSDCGVSFPDFPGLATAGTDLDDARRMAEEALALPIDGTQEDGEAIPEPSSLETTMSDRETEAALQSSSRLRRRPVESRARQCDVAGRRYAEEHGLTRSGLLLHAARRQLRAA